MTTKPDTETATLPKTSNTKRVWLTFETSKVDAIIAAAEDYGMPVSSFAGLCAWIGFKTIIRQIDPDKMLTTDQWVDIIEAAKKRGLVDEQEVKDTMGV